MVEIQPTKLQLYCSECDSSCNKVVHWRVVLISLQRGGHTLKNIRIIENNVRSCRFTELHRNNLRKKPVKSYIWSIDLDGADTGTLRKVDQQYLECFELWCWGRTRKRNWTDRVNNEELLHRIERQGTPYIQQKDERLTDWSHLA